MRRGTTPVLTCSVHGADFSNYRIYATLQQGGLEMTIEDPICETSSEGCKVTIILTQEQSLRFKKGEALIQLRCINEEGVAVATSIATINIEKILKNGEIYYE